MSLTSERRRLLLKGLAGVVGLGAAGGPATEEARAAPACAAPRLPQDDADPFARERQLERARERYVYDYTRVPSLPMVEKVPGSDAFSTRWIAQGLNRVRDLIENFAPGGGVSSASRRTRSLEDYEGLFRSIALPEIARDFQDDRVFARQRVAGPNPLVLQRLDRLPDRFPVTERMYRSAVPGDRLRAALREGRLYLADYAVLAGVELGEVRGAAKFLSAPLALFAVDQRSAELLPVAIQCEPTPGPDNPVFTPRDAHAWAMAKTVVQIADANLHEAVSHLGRTHLFIEPFVIATERQLAPSHPLRLLLRPHFEGTLAINEFAYTRLLRKGGFVDVLLAGTLEESIRLAVTGVQTYSFEDAMLPTALRARGVDEKDALPHYPYRDDALLYWEAIRNWVSDYLRVYYRSTQDVRDDFELAAWHRELVAQDGGRVRGFGKNGSVGDLEDLIDAAALVIFTSSVQHAAVNFPQLDLMTYVPNMPLAGFAPPPRSRRVSEQDWLDLLPPLSSARKQLVILYLLGSVHHTTLGLYGARELCDPRLEEPLAKFRRELERIGDVIEDRNLVRPAYRFLEPSGIPQSINV